MPTDVPLPSAIPTDAPFSFPVPSATTTLGDPPVGHPYDVAERSSVWMGYRERQNHSLVVQYGELDPASQTATRSARPEWQQAQTTNTDGRQTGEIVKWSLFLGGTLLVTAFLVGAYMHAKRRIRKGLPPLGYHRVSCAPPWSACFPRTTS